MSDMFRQSPAETANATPFHALPTYRAEDLTRDGATAMICLGDQTYVLRITRAGKLILTK